jgi:hypothetical protein
MHMYLISWLFVYLLYIITCVLFELLFVELWLRTLGEKLRDFSMQDLFRNIVFMNYSLHPKIIVRLG